MSTMHFADPSQPSCPTCFKQVPDRVEVMYMFCFTLPVYTKSEVRINNKHCSLQLFTRDDYLFQTLDRLDILLDSRELAELESWQAACCYKQRTSFIAT